MTAPRFQLLLERLPQVAEVVNRFQSAELQRDVLQALLKALDHDATANGRAPIGEPAAFADRSALDDLGPVVIGQGIDLEAPADASSIHDA